MSGNLYEIFMFVGMEILIHCFFCRDLFHQQQSSSHQQHHNVQQQQPSSSSSKHEKKKKWWKRRSSRSSDPGQPLRELLANWSLGEVVALGE